MYIKNLSEPQIFSCLLLPSPAHSSPSEADSATLVSRTPPQARAELGESSATRLAMACTSEDGLYSNPDRTMGRDRGPGFSKEPGQRRDAGTKWSEIDNEELVDKKLFRSVQSNWKKRGRNLYPVISTHKGYFVRWYFNTKRLFSLKLSCKCSITWIADI